MVGKIGGVNKTVTPTIEVDLDDEDDEVGVKEVDVIDHQGRPGLRGLRDYQNRRG